MGCGRKKFIESGFYGGVVVFGRREGKVWGLGFLYGDEGYVFRFFSV